LSKDINFLITIDGQLNAWEKAYIFMAYQESKPSFEEKTVIMIFFNA
jgi:hypothetical protein